MPLACIFGLASSTDQAVRAAGTEFAFDRNVLAWPGVAFTYPATLAFEPDGRLHLAEWNGRMRALTLNPDTKGTTAIQLVAQADDLQEVLGIAFNPADASMPPPVYVSNTVSGWGLSGEVPD